MDDIPTPDEARDWLKEYGQSPDISITWEIPERDDPAVIAAILDILFSPHSGGKAA